MASPRWSGWTWRSGRRGLSTCTEAWWPPRSSRSSPRSRPRCTRCCRISRPGWPKTWSAARSGWPAAARCCPAWPTGSRPRPASAPSWSRTRRGAWSAARRRCWSARITTRTKARTRADAPGPDSGRSPDQGSGRSPEQRSCRTAIGRSRISVLAGRRSGVAGSAFLQDGEDVAGRVLEPGDVGAAGPVDALVVLAAAVIFLQLDAPADQFVHGRVDVIDGEVEDRVGRRRVVGLGVDQRVAAAGQVQGQQAVLLGSLQPERLAVELLRRLEVVDGEPAERPGVLEHVMLLSMGRIRTHGIDPAGTVNSSLVAR